MCLGHVRSRRACCVFCVLLVAKVCVISAPRVRFYSISLMMARPPQQIHKHHANQLKHCAYVRTKNFSAACWVVTSLPKNAHVDDGHNANKTIRSASKQYSTIVYNNCPEVRITITGTIRAAYTTRRMTITITETRTNAKMSEVQPANAVYEIQLSATSEWPQMN